MKPIEFPEQNVVFAKNQPQYLQLPAYKSHESNGEVISCWQLTFKERLKILFTGIFWFRQWTFNKPLQPQRPDINCPFIRNKK